MFLISLLSTAALPELVIVALGALMTGLICQFALPIGTALGLLDEPEAKRHSRHTRVTPLVGGIAISLPLLIFNLVGSQVSVIQAWTGGWPVSGWLGLVVAAMLLMGSIDDRLHLSARLRLAGMALTFTLVALFDPVVTIHHLQFPPLGFAMTLGPWAVVFTALCLSALVNAINMADGRNGLVIGMCIIWCFALLTQTLNPRPIELLMILASLCIALVFNVRGKLFLGDGGTYSLAAFIGITVVVSHNLTDLALSAPQVACLFVIPVLDMLRLIVERLRRGASPMAPDHDHLHHYLDVVFGWNLGLPVYLLMVAAPIVIGFRGADMGFVGLILGLLVYLVVWRLTRQEGAAFAQHQANLGSKAS